MRPLTYHNKYEKGDETLKKKYDHLTKRAVLYARVSGDDRGKEGRNLIGQIEMCREFAQERGWSIVEEISEDDRGASGASFELPELSRIIDIAHKGRLMSWLFGKLIV